MANETSTAVAAGPLAAGRLGFQSRAVLVGTGIDVAALGSTDRTGNAPLVVFRHKEGTMSSITGEKLGEAHVAAALGAVAFRGAGICLAPLYQETPCYVAAVEGSVDAAEFDRALCAANEEYDAKRKSLRLGPVVVVDVAAGSFVAARSRRVKAGAPDAHVKLPTLSRDGALLKELGVPAAIAANLQAPA